MLQLVLGRAGTGKTTWLHQKLQTLVHSNLHELILIVPEQDSFAHERALLNLLGEKQAGAVEVLSFTRLANSLFRACGGRCGRVNISDAQRAIAMSLALDTVRDKLELFAKAGERLIPGLLRLRRELSMCGTNPDDFFSATRSLKQAKLRELAQIMQAYDAVLETRFGGHCDAMQGLYESLATPQGRAFFSGKVVAIDSFLGFTPAELRILGRVLEYSETVFCTLCLDKLHGNETDVLAHTRRTAAALQSLARQADVPIKTPIVLIEQHRFQCQELAKLEAAFFSQEAEPLSCPPVVDSIKLCVCEDIEAECALIATRIKALLRKGFRCRDIAVLARDFSAYEQPLVAALRRVSIPLFEDRRQPVATQPLMRCVAAALDIAENGFSRKAVMRWLKAGLTELDEEGIALLEDYALLWRVEGQAWLREWTAHPQGLGQVENEISDLQLTRLNTLRMQVIAPLEMFRNAMQDCTGLDGAIALDALLQGAKIPAGLKRLRVGLEDAQGLELCRVWDLLMELMDQIAQGLGEQNVGAARFRALFELVLSLQTLGQLPQSLDAVTFGAADRVRLQSPKAVFVLGLNDGIFPRTPMQESLVSDRERAQLTQQAGLIMQDSAPLQLAMERIIVYRTLTAAQEHLHLSWALRTSEELQPSKVVHWLREQFPKLEIEDAAYLPPEELLEGKHAAFALLCREHNKQSALYTALHSYFERDPKFAPRLAALKRTVMQPPQCIENPETARALFRNAAYLSPSRVESYARCPFQYFCNYGLKARAHRPVDFDPLLRGDILHHLFEQIFKCHNTEALLDMSPTERKNLLNNILDDYAEKQLSVENLPARVTYLFNRLRAIAAQVFERMIEDFRQSAFRPTACELRIDMDQNIKPYKVALPDGTVLRSGGKADRIDCATVNGQRYFRVVDYKSGSKAFDLGAVFDGLGLQMLVYLFALQNANFENAKPAGILYQQARDPVLKPAQRNVSSQSLANAKRKETRPSGFMVEHTHESSPVRNTLSPADLDKLKQQVDHVLAEMAQKLRTGKIPALPLQNPTDYQNTTCAFCDFQAICGRESGSAARLPTKLTFEEAVARLNETYPE